MIRLISLLFAGLLGMIVTTQAQIISADPEAPTIDDEVTITFDAIEGTGGLANCNCDVYLHTGLITSASVSDSDWKYVVTEWGQANPDWQMTRVSGEDNLYQFTISPSIREFYGLGPNEQVERLAFVFRDATGSQEGKADGGGDIFYDLPQGAIQLIAPAESNLVKNLGDIINIQASSETPADFTVTDNGVELFQGQGTTLIYELAVTEPGRHTVEVEVLSAVEQQTFVFNYLALAPAAEEPGIYLPGDDAMRLVLYAPEKESVHVIGSFNDWQVDEAYRMTPSADGATFSITIDGLTPGEDVLFQYLVDGNLRIADPYSTVVLDPAHDRFIPSVTYPNLPDYPVGQTTGIVTLVPRSTPDYTWTTDDFQAPPQEELVIYELLIRDFIDRHDYTTLIDTLHYLDALGVNAIELMPVNEFEGNISWGYNPSYHMALDKYYGPINEFKRFVDSCHARGIAVLLDVVYNHAFSQSPLAQLYWDQSNFRPSPDNPWLNPVARHPFNVGYDFNHESLATRTFVDKVIQYWLREFRVDGFRFDLSKGFTQRLSSDDGLFRQYDAARIATLKHYSDVARAINPDAHLILEHFAENREELELAEYGFMLWAGFGVHDNYTEAAMGYNSNFNDADYMNRAFEEPALVAYMESHDEERMMYKCLEFGNSNAGYDIQDFSTALDRLELASVFFYTIPGPKMLWQFGELGYDFPINYCPDGTISEGCRTDLKPIRWDYFQQRDRRDLYEVVRALANLKTAYDVFNTTEYDLNVSRQDWKRIHLFGDEMDVAIQGNFDVVPVEVSTAFPSTGWWYEYFSGDSLLVENLQTPMSLAPGEYRLYTSAAINLPDRLPTSRYEVVRDRFELRVFPNPADDRINVRYTLEQGGRVTLDLYSLTGQHLRRLSDGRRPTGAQESAIDADLPPGTYLLRLTVDRQVESTLLLVR